jgi:hypothetical protein
MKLFVDLNKLQEYHNKSNVNEFLTSVRAHVINNPGVRLNCQIEPVSKPEKQIFLQSGSEIIGQVGMFYEGLKKESIKLETPENKPRLHSLNIGSFGLNSQNNEISIAYKQNMQTFIDYVKSVSPSVLAFSLQDVPNDANLFSELNAHGFDIYFFPNMFYHLGKFESRPDCGQALLVNKNIEDYDLKMLNISLSYHWGGFPDYNKSFKKHQTEDYLHKPTTLYFTIQNRSKHEYYLISNAYVSAFSNQDDRFKNIKDSVKIMDQMIKSISKFKKSEELIVRFTGDFNLYGYDTLRGPFGMKSEPWSHLPAVISALLSGFRPLSLFSGKIFKIGKNTPNLIEVDKVKAWLKTRGYGIATDTDNNLKQSKTVMVEEFAPSFIKRLFKGAGASWVLDMCIFPAWGRKFNIWYDKEPFGDIDHETLIIQL